METGTDQLTAVSGFCIPSPTRDTSDWSCSWMRNSRLSERKLPGVASIATRSKLRWEVCRFIPWTVHENEIVIGESDRSK